MNLREKINKVGRYLKEDGKQTKKDFSNLYQKSRDIMNLVKTRYKEITPYERALLRFELGAAITILGISSNLHSIAGGSDFGYIDDIVMWGGVPLIANGLSTMLVCKVSEVYKFAKNMYHKHTG